MMILIDFYQYSHSNSHSLNRAKQTLFNDPSRVHKVVRLSYDPSDDHKNKMTFVEGFLQLIILFDLAGAYYNFRNIKYSKSSVYCHIQCVAFTVCHGTVCKYHV